MTWRWHYNVPITFWQPIIDPSLKDWRKQHILAHLVGGMVWAVVFRFLILASPSHIWLDLRSSAWLRLLAVAVWQFTFWEMIQRENWRPELMDPPHPPGGYPMLSAVWDTVFTVIGAGLLELLLWVLR